MTRTPNKPAARQRRSGLSVRFSRRRPGVPERERSAHHGMRFRPLTLISLMMGVLLSAYADPQDKKALQGKWQATEATSNGEAPPAGLLEKLSLIFTNDMVIIMGAPLTRFAIDTNFTPARIDILNSRHQVGIYELKGDTLKLCVGMDGDRPKAFRTQKYTDHTYMLLKRVKE